MAIGNVFEGWCPCGATHVKATLVEEYEQIGSKDDPLPHSDDLP
jgi:hypothetical protein